MKLSLTRLIHQTLGITGAQLDRLIQRSPYTYKVYNIPKRSGGYRTIAQPAKETKFVQHWIINNVLHVLPIHESATAYKNGASIKANALIHKDNQYITKFDFKDFFSSVKEVDLRKHFSLHFQDKYNEVDIRRIAQISCIRHYGSAELCLSIGAPSSPLLSNTILFEFDCNVAEWCTEHNISYSRYADDLTFSTNIKNISSEIEITIKKMVENLEYPRLTFNEKKTTHLSKKSQRRITGLIINNNNEISLGRERKREISSLIHRFKLGLLSNNESYRLQGLLGFARDVEPLFIVRMDQKYGKQLLQDIFQKRKLS